MSRHKITVSKSACQMRCTHLGLGPRPSCPRTARHPRAVHAAANRGLRDTCIIKCSPTCIERLAKPEPPVSGGSGGAGRPHHSDVVGENLRCIGGWGVGGQRKQTDTHSYMPCLLKSSVAVRLVIKCTQVTAHTSLQSDSSFTTGL